MTDHALVVANLLLAQAQSLKVSLSWESATQEAKEYIDLILHNNPRKSVDEVLKRKDISDMLADVYGSAAVESIAEITKAWEDKVKNTEISTYDLDLVLRRTRKMARQAPEKLLAAYSTEAPAQTIAALKTELVSRAAKSHEYISQVADQLKVLDGATGANKRWLSHDWPGRCKTCLDLHGQTIPVGELFSSPKGPKIFGILLTPPRHPGCRCYIEIV